MIVILSTIYYKKFDVFYNNDLFSRNFHITIKITSNLAANNYCKQTVLIKNFKKLIYNKHEIVIGIMVIFYIKHLVVYCSSIHIRSLAHPLNSQNYSKT